MSDIIVPNKYFASLHVYCFSSRLGYNLIFGMNAMHDNSERRSGIERRQIVYDAHIPENRTTIERRSGHDRRRSATAPLPLSSEKRKYLADHSDD